MIIGILRSLLTLLTGDKFNVNLGLLLVVEYIIIVIEK